MCSRTALSVAAAAVVVATAVNAAPVAPAGARSASFVVTVAQKQSRQRKDCTPYNGPFGFYGNIWCQPPNEMSYLRNLGSPWPQETPPALRKTKPDTSTDW